MIEILNVRRNDLGYLVNGIHQFTDNDPQILDWISKGKEVLPPYTLDEINFFEITRKIVDFKKYLSDTDYKLLPFYEPKDGENLNEIIAKRSEARQFIRDNENAML